MWTAAKDTGSDSDFEVDLGESLHPQSDARLAVYKIRKLSLDRPGPLPLLGRRRAWDSELGVTAGRRLHGPPSGRLDQLQLRYCHLQRDQKFGSFFYP